MTNWTHPTTGMIGTLNDFPETIAWQGSHQALMFYVS